MIRSFHPQHLSDLRKSGLNDVTIDAAGIYTVPPGEIGKKLGGLANNVVNALAFPYPGFDGYERYKVWREEGKTGPKYIQKTGTPNHLYLPPTLDHKGDSHLLVGEGEKKALALMQSGFQVVGIGGVFSWLTKTDGDSHPLPDFDLLNWRRPVTILFDSDGSNNPKVRLAAWRLGREVARRGGQIMVLFLPAGPNGEKVGADDYLVAYNRESLTELLSTAWPYDSALNDHEAEIHWHLRGITAEDSTLDKIRVLDLLIPVFSEMRRTEMNAILEGVRERLKLRAKDLTDLAFDIKRARKQKKKKEAAVLTLDKLADVYRLHPSIDFPGDVATIGFRVDIPGDEGQTPVGLLLLISDGQGVRVEVDPERGVKIGERIYQIKPGAQPFLRDVWGLDRLKAFMAHPSCPKGLYNGLKGAYQTYLDLPDAAYGLMVAWTVATYFAQIFTAFPFLHFHGPKESGKSKSLEAMRYTCFNAWKGRDVTAAALGDTVDGQRGTILLDQAEKLNSDENTHLVGLLADSYKKAGGQRRVVEITKGGRSVLEFSTYGPKAFASKKPLDSDLADRCIRIPMIRTRLQLPDLEGWEPVWGELRDKLYRFTLAAFKEVQAQYEANHGNGTRIGELWRPMLAVLLALGVEDTEIESIRALFMDAAQEGRYEPSGWECSLLEVIREKAKANEKLFDLTVSDIIKAMNIEGDKQPGGKWIGDTIGNYHLATKKTRPRIDGRQTTAYTFDPMRVKELCEIYFRETPQNVVHIVHSKEITNELTKIPVNEGEGCSRIIMHREGGNDGGVHDCSRTEKASCTTQDTKIINEIDRVHDVHEKSGATEKIFPHFLGEVEL